MTPKNQQAREQDLLAAERERRIQEIMVERGVQRDEAEVIWRRRRRIGGAIIRANEERKEQQERERVQHEAIVALAERLGISLEEAARELEVWRRIGPDIPDEESDRFDAPHESFINED